MIGINTLSSLNTDFSEIGHEESMIKLVMGSFPAFATEGSTLITEISQTGFNNPQSIFLIHKD